MSISNLTMPNGINLYCNNLGVFNELTAGDMIIQNIQVDNIGVDGDMNIKGELTLNMNNNIFPMVWNQNQVLSLTAQNTLQRTTVSGDGGIIGINSNSLNVSELNNIADIELKAIYLESVTAGTNITIDNRNRLLMQTIAEL